MSVPIKASLTKSDVVALTALSTFNSLPDRGKPKDSEWSVLAAFVLEEINLNHDRDFQQLATAEQARMRTVALATGSKCLGRGAIVSAAEAGCSGSVLHDSHAEVIARRSLLRLLYEELSLKLSSPRKHCNDIVRDGLLEEISPSDDDAVDPSEFAFAPCHQALREPRDQTDLTGDSGRRFFRLRRSCRLHLYVSEPPCGDASIYRLLSQNVDSDHGGQDHVGSSPHPSGGVVDVVGRAKENPIADGIFINSSESRHRRGGKEAGGGGQDDPTLTTQVHPAGGGGTRKHPHSTPTLSDALESDDNTLAANDKRRVQLNFTGAKLVSTLAPPHLAKQTYCAPSSEKRGREPCGLDIRQKGESEEERGVSFTSRVEAGGATLHAANRGGSGGRQIGQALCAGKGNETEQGAVSTDDSNAGVDGAGGGAGVGAGSGGGERVSPRGRRFELEEFGVREPGEQVLGGLRLKSGRSNLARPEERTMSMSCSDKIVRWCVQGLQGTLLAHWIPESIALTSITVSCHAPASHTSCHTSSSSKRGREAPRLNNDDEEEEDRVKSAAGGGKKARVEPCEEADQFNATATSSFISSSTSSSFSSLSSSSSSSSSPSSSSLSSSPPSSSSSSSLQSPPAVGGLLIFPDGPGALTAALARAIPERVRAAAFAQSGDTNGNPSERTTSGGGGSHLLPLLPSVHASLLHTFSHSLHGRTLWAQQRERGTSKEPYCWKKLSSHTNPSEPHHQPLPSSETFPAAPQAPPKLLNSSKRAEIPKREQEQKTPLTLEADEPEPNRKRNKKGGARNGPETAASSRCPRFSPSGVCLNWHASVPFRERKPTAKQQPPPKPLPARDAAQNSTSNPAATTSGSCDNDSTEVIEAACATTPAERLEGQSASREEVEEDVRRLSTTKPPKATPRKPDQNLELLPSPPPPSVELVGECEVTVGALGRKQGAKSVVPAPSMKKKKKRKANCPGGANDNDDDDGGAKGRVGGGCGGGGCGGGVAGVPDKTQSRLCKRALFARFQHLEALEDSSPPLPPPKTVGAFAEPPLLPESSVSASADLESPQALWSNADSSSGVNEGGRPPRSRLSSLSYVDAKRAVSALLGERRRRQQRRAGLTEDLSCSGSPTRHDDGAALGTSSTFGGGGRDELTSGACGPLLAHWVCCPREHQDFTQAK